MTTKLIRDRHWQTQALVDAFLALKEGEIVLRDDLAKRCNMDRKAVDRHYDSAKRVVLRDHHVVIDIAVRGESVQRLPQERVVEPVARGVGRIRATARGMRRTINHGVTDYSKLPRDVQSTLHMQNAIAGTVLLATAKGSQKILKEAAKAANSELNIGRTLELLK